jgi:RHS repeat-associated protein
MPFLLVGKASAAGSITITINSTLDQADPTPGTNVCTVTPAGGPCTLRAAIQDADAIPGSTAVTVVVPPGTYSLSVAPAGSNDVTTGDLNIDRSMTINGAGASTTIVDGSQLDRIFRVSSGANVSIAGLTVRNGLVGPSSPPDTQAEGGGIWTAGSLSLTGVSVTSNSANGGASGFGYGGGIFVASGASLIVNFGSISSDTATGAAAWGGGIESNASRVSIGASQVNNDSANAANGSDYGGGLDVEPGATLTTLGGDTFNNDVATSSYGATGGGAINIQAGELDATTLTAEGDQATAPGLNGGSTSGGAIDFSGAALDLAGDNFANDLSSTDSSAAFGGAVAASSSSSIAISNTTISSSTVQSPSTSTCCGGVAYGGGAYLNATSSITVTNDVVQSNMATNTLDAGSNAVGGGLYLGAASIGIGATTIAGNHADAGGAPSFGGGIYSTGSSTMQVLASTISGNEASATDGSDSANGGGMYDNSTALVVQNTTIANNATYASNGTGGGGGGLYTGGSFTSGAASTATLNYDTIDSNSQAGGGGDDLVAGSAATTKIDSTIVAGPTSTNCAALGTLSSSGHNIDSGTSCGLTSTTDKSNANPGLGSLGSNGGPTQTQALTSSSPALDGGDAGTCPGTDQRGLSRPQGAGCDIGAYELGTPGATPPQAGPQGSELWGFTNPAEPGACSCQTQPTTGDPVQSVSGNFVEAADDMSVTGRGRALDFTRTYNTLDAATASAPDALGYGWTDSYAMSLSFDSTTGNITVHQQNGATATFSPSGSSYTAPAWVVATLVKNGDGTYTVGLPNQDKDNFSSAGQLLSETDRNGYKTILSYTSGLLTSVTDPAGRSFTLGYDSSNRLTSVSGPDSRTVGYGYDANGNLSTVTDVAGGVTTYGYDTLHRLTTITDARRNAVATNVYDSANRVTSQTDALHRSTTWSYGLGQTTITDPNGNITVERYSFAELTSRTRGFGTPQAATWTYDYDRADNISAVTDPNGRTTQMVHDDADNLVSVTDPLARRTTYTYDTLNDLTSATDPAGTTTTYTYDPAGNLLGISRPLSGTTQSQTTAYTYGDAAHPGDVTSLTDPDGNAWTTAYDANGDVVRVVDPLGDAATAAYNSVGWKTSWVSPDGNAAGANASSFTTTVTYNAFGGPVTVKDPLGNTTTYSYDANQDLTSVSDPDHNTTGYVYDAENQLTQVNRPGGTSLKYGYDADGNQNSQTDGASDTTGYAFDPLNRLVSVTDPLGRVTSYSYDLASNRTAQQDPGGNCSVTPKTACTTYGYDAAKELVSITYSDGTTPNVAYAYTADGQRSSMTDGTGTTTYAYDSLNRLTASTDGSGAAVSFGYDLAGRLTSLGYPNDKSVQRGFDAAGRMTSVTDWRQNTTAFSYDANSNMLTESYPNGTMATYSFDPADRLVQTVDTTAAGLPFLTLPSPRDPDGLVTAGSPAGTGTPADTQSLGYDALQRLTQVALPTPGVASNVSYDSADRISNLTVSGGTPPTATFTDTYDQASQLATTTISGGGLTSPVTEAYQFDNRGDRTGQSLSIGGVSLSATLGYDQAKRLTSFSGPPLSTFVSTSPVTGNSSTTSYTYNGDGLRMTKTILTPTPATTVHFAWNVSRSLPTLLSDGNNFYVYGPDGSPLEQITGTMGTALWFHHDQLGSTRALTNQLGAVVATFTYSAYGGSSSLGAASTPLRFAGQYVDSETALVYLRHRYYDPATGTFLSVDPAVSITQAPYTYTSDDPINLTDPLGLCSANPFSSSSCLSQAWNDTGGQAVHWVKQHPREAIGIGLGVVSVATGGIGLGADLAFEGTLLTTTVADTTALATGAGAAYLDTGKCLSGDKVACIGAGLGVAGAAGAVPSVIGDLIGVEVDTLPFGTIKGASAFGLLSGLSATVFDPFAAASAAVATCR